MSNHTPSESLSKFLCFIIVASWVFICLMKCASFCESEDEQQRQKDLKREEADYARSLRFEERNKYSKKVYWDRPAPPEEQRQAQRMQPHIPDANSDRRNRNTSHDVYAEGYDAGYEAGEDDGASGCGRYNQYDESNHYSADKAHEYEAGYEDGNQDGYNAECDDDD